MGEDNVQQLKMVADLFRHSKMAEDSFVLCT